VAAATGPTATGTPSTSGSAAASSPEPGQGGGRVRVVARDLAASFARELPPGSDSMPAWRTLPLGEVGEVTVELRTDDEGRLSGESIFAEKRPQEALAEVVKRTRLRLGRSAMAPAGTTAGPGVVKVRMRARIEAIPVPDDQPGGSFALGWKFDAEHGECTFSLQEGRRVTVTLDVVSRTSR
jgi:hypothetical protein